MIVKPILDAAKRIALQKAKNYAVENMSHGPDALSAIEPEIHNLAAEIYGYQARFEEAQKVVHEDLLTSADFTHYCIRAIPLSEIEGIDQLIKTLKEIQSVSADIEAGAIGRARSQAEKARVRARQWRTTLDRAERHHEYSRMVANITKRLRDAEKQAYNYESKMRATDLRGDAIERTIADLIGRLTEIKRELREHPGFAVFARKCREWKFERIEEGTY